MKKRVAVLSVVLVVLIALSAGAEQLSKIAVVNFAKVVENFPSGSPAFSRLQKLKDDYETKRQEYLEELNRKELSLVEAREEESDLRIANLEREIEDFKSFIKQWQEIKLKEIEIVQNDFMRGDDVVSALYSAIEFIAINEGYTMVVADTDTGIIWYSPEIDITDLVISRLRALAR